MVKSIPRDLSIFTSLDCCAIVVKGYLRNWCIFLILRARRHRGGGIGGVVVPGQFLFLAHFSRPCTG
eukprot:8483694-Pyramimonas_sp.AAC.1